MKTLLLYRLLPAAILLVCVGGITLACCTGGLYLPVLGWVHRQQQPGLFGSLIAIKLVIAAAAALFLFGVLPRRR